MILSPERWAVGGDAVARTDDGRVAFVEGALPGEEVRVQVLVDKKRFVRARVTQVLKPSADRVEPECPHFGTCGGCSHQFVSASAQAHGKAQAGRDALARIGGLSLEAIDEEPTWFGAPYGYRSRARWWVRDGRLGYRAARSHRLVEVERCPISTPDLEAARAALAGRLPPQGEGEVWAVAADSAVAVYSERWPDWTRADLGVDVVPPDQALPVLDAAGPRFVSPALFTQASATGNDALLETLRRWLKPVSRGLELYAGSGNFTRVLASFAEQVVAAEIEPAAVALADRVRSEHTSLWTATAEDAVARALAEGYAPELVLVDPPRAGLAPGALKGILQLAPPTLLYVSCDPATSARDAKLLCAADYQLARLRFFDLYPQTPHVEVMGRFERSSSR